MQIAEFEPAILGLPDWRPRRHGCLGCTVLSAIFDKLKQLLLHSKVAKAELYLIGGYHNEWLELTYYKEALVFSIGWAQCVSDLFIKMVSVKAKMRLGKEKFVYSYHKMIVKCL